MLNYFGNLKIKTNKNRIIDKSLVIRFMKRKFTVLLRGTEQSV
jgi:hypothetical protein